MRRLKQLKDENAKAEIVAACSLDREMLQDAVRRNVWSAPPVQASGRSDDDSLLSGLSRVSCGCSQAMMRSWNSAGPPTITNRVAEQVGLHRSR
jgi:hypothetical protein